MFSSVYLSSVCLHACLSVCLSVSPSVCLPVICLSACLSSQILSSSPKTERLKASALRYGRACNGLLRSVACAYQELVLKRDCGVQKNKTTTSATVTVSVATSTTTTATATTSSSTSTTTATTSSNVTTSGTTRRKGRALTVENTQVPSTMAKIFEH